MKNKGIIFDLDGVIVDTAKYHYLAWKKIADDLGFDFTENDNERLKGVSRIKSLDILLDLGKIELSEAKKSQLLQEKNENYLASIEKLNTNDLLPGIQNLLSWLNQNKIPFALGSASKNARKILNQLGITELFTAIVDGNDVTKAKPDPEVFLIAAKKMNIKPENCIVIEDSQAGIDAAKTASMKAIAIGKHLKNADFNLASTAKLSPEFIEKIIKN